MCMGNRPDIGDERRGRHIHKPCGEVVLLPVTYHLYFGIVSNTLRFIADGSISDIAGRNSGVCLTLAGAKPGQRSR